jgi:ribosomal protein S13
MKELADCAFCIYGEQVRGQVTKTDAKMTGSQRTLEA